MSINFEGIKWADYQGDINNLDEEEPEISENDIPIGISGLLSDEGISIQNYGNAMNSYQKLNGSGEKYLLFKSTDTLDYPNPGYSISY